MNKYFCTFGSDENYPFGRNDYVVVMAQDMNAAYKLFMVAHPNPRKYEGADSIANFADCYSEEQWKEIAPKYYRDVEPIETISLTIGYEVSNRPCRDRESEIASKTLHALFDAEEESAIEFINDELDMSESEKEYYGVDARIDEYESEGIR